jgi:hypothetical protein
VNKKGLKGKGEDDVVREDWLKKGRKREREEKWEKEMKEGGLVGLGGGGGGYKYIQ